VVTESAAHPFREFVAVVEARRALLRGDIPAAWAALTTYQALIGWPGKVAIGRPSATAALPWRAPSARSAHRFYSCPKHGRRQ
jgi:hypothetical protein